MTEAPRLLPKQPPFANRVQDMTDFLEWREQAAEARTPLLVAVTGPEGVGKTTFSVVAAHRVAADYPDAQLHYDVRGSDPKAMVTADQVAVYFLGQLGVPREAIPQDPDERVGMFRSSVAHRRVLMVLDDVDDIQVVRKLLFESDDAVVVVTSRRPLNGLRPDGFRLLRLGRFEGADAVELMSMIAGVDLDEQVVNTLCVLCDGLPLALSIAAVRLSDPDEPAEEYIEELLRGTSFEAFQVDGVDMVVRVFDAMRNDLDETAARAHLLLNLVPGPHFGVGVAAAVLELDEAATKRVLRELVGKHLLDRHGDAHFRFHNLIHVHALDRVVDELAHDEIERAVARAVEWYWRRCVALDQVVSARPIPVPAEEHYRMIPPAFTGENALTRAFSEFDVEWPNLVAAAREAHDVPNSPQAALFPLSMWFYGYTTRRYPELLDAYQRAVPLAREGRALWQLHRDLAAIHEGLGEFDLVAEQVALAARVDYPAGRESVLTWHGLEMEGRGDLAGALTEFRAALDAVPLMADPVQEERARALLNMHIGRVLYRLGDRDPGPLAAAHAYFAARPAERVNEARAAMWFGRVLADQGEGTALLEGTLAALRELGMPQDAARVADALVDYAETAGDAAAARAYRELAEELRG